MSQLAPPLMGFRVPQDEKARIPLQEQNSNTGVRVTDTPVAYKNSKVTTTPESIYVSKKSSVLDTTPISRPVGLSSLTEHAPLKQETALLSPAFSSPQQKFFYPNPPPKPSFMDYDTSKKKKKAKKELKESGFDISSSEKPPYSYANLIGMSILTTPEKKLTLSLIYSWISETFRYYKREDVGWQNSIRHNLSLNKAFVKGDKSKDGKGHFWCIKEGCEDQFLKSRNNKKSGFQEVMDQLKKIDHQRHPHHSINSIPSSPNFSSMHSSIDSESSQKRKLDEYLLDADDVHTDKDAYEFDDEKDVKRSRYNESLKTPKFGDTPQFIISDSPNKPMLAGKNLTYTSSFSCNSNFELSPLRSNDTGPLLEPLTPANNIYKHGANLQASIQSHSQSLSQYQITNYTPNGVPSHSSLHVRTPKASKTPLRILKTPQTASIMKKLWNSPSYLDDFYYSPLVSATQGGLTSYDDDDMILRAYDSPAQLKKSNSSVDSSRNLFNDLKKIDSMSSVDLLKSKDSRRASLTDQDNE